MAATLSHWRIFTNTAKPDAARRVVAKLKELAERAFLSMSVESYHKGGHVVTFDITHDCANWRETVYDVIACAQRMGHDWSIAGFIDEELDLSSTKIPISGITAATCCCFRPEPRE